MEHGRPANATRFSARQLDIDILTYDEVVGTVEGVQLPRGEILENAFVLCPLAELAPDTLHPAAAQLRNCGRPTTGFAATVKVDFRWRGADIAGASWGLVTIPALGISVTASGLTRSASSAARALR